MFVRHDSHARPGFSVWSWRGLFAFAGWALTVASSQAQSEQVPNPSPPPQTPIEAALPPAEEPGRWTPWTVGLTAQQGYDWSDQDTVDETTNLGISTSFGASTGRSWLLRRGYLGFSGNVGKTVYREGQDLFMYAAGVTASHMFTRRLSQNFAAAVDRSYGEDSSLLVNAGVVLPQVVTETQVFATSVTYRLSPKNSVDGAISASRVAFPSTVQLSTDLSYTLHAAFTRQIDRNHSLSVSFGNTISTSGSGDVQGLIGTYTGRFGRRLTLSAAGGIKPYRVTGDSELRFAPGTLVGFSIGTWREQTASVTYEHTVEQAYGLLGTHLCDRFNSAYSLGIGRASITGYANYGYNSYPELPGYTQAGGRLGAEVSIDLGRKLSLGANYIFFFSRENADSTASSVQSARAGVSLGYSLSF